MIARSPAQFIITSNIPVHLFQGAAQFMLWLTGYFFYTVLHDGDVLNYTCDPVMCTWTFLG